VTPPARTLGALAATAALAGGLLATAPTAGAATSTSCSQAWVVSKGRGYLSQTFDAQITDCNFADQGAPYTFVIATMHVTATFVNPPYHYTLTHVTATCTSAPVSQGWIVTNGCTYVY
jgi:hypothetical protein